MRRKKMDRNYIAIELLKAAKHMTAGVKLMVTTRNKGEFRKLVQWLKDLNVDGWNMMPNNRGIMIGEDAFRKKTSAGRTVAEALESMARMRKIKLDYV